MALIKCEECGKTISDEAKTCPHCGVKHIPQRIKRNIKWNTRILIGFVIVVVFGSLIIHYCSPKGKTKPYKPSSPSLGVQENSIVKITDSPAKLRPSPDYFENYLIEIPTGTELKVLDTNSVRTGGTVQYAVIWYKVEYKGKTGWISEYVCKKIK